MLALNPQFGSLDLGSATSPTPLWQKPVVVPWESLGIPIERLSALLELWQSAGLPETPRYHFGSVPFFRTDLLQRGISCCGDGPGAEILKTAMSPHIVDIFRQITGAAQVDFTQILINRMEPGSEIRVHAHPSYDFTAVMVLRLPEIGGHHFSIDGKRHPPTQLSGLRLYDLVVESGHTIHGVTKVEGRRDRISLVWGINGKQLGPLAQLLGAAS